MFMSLCAVWLIAACQSQEAPIQRLSEAKAAIEAAKQLPNSAAVLQPALEAYERAAQLSREKDYQAAQLAAERALQVAQAVLRGQ